jgi:hypothetical protein
MEEKNLHWWVSVGGKMSLEVLMRSSKTWSYSNL